MFELNETLELNEMTMTWNDRTYRTERGLRRFLATLSEAQLAEAEIMVDDDTFVVFYPVLVPVRKEGPDSAFHFDLSDHSEGSCPLTGTKVEVQQSGQLEEAEEARRKAERAAAFQVLLAGVLL